MERCLCKRSSRRVKPVRLFRPTLRRRAADGSMGPKSKTRTWWADFTVHGRRYRISTGTSNRTAAAHVAAKLAEQRRDHGPSGDPFNLTRTADPLVLVTEYAKGLRAKGKNARHVQVTEQRVRRLLEGVHRLDAVTPQQIEAALERIATTPVARPNRSAVDLSAQTVNRYRVGLASFFNWLVKGGRWPSNPAKAVGSRKVTERTRERRALTMPELARLVGAAALRPLQRRGRGSTAPAFSLGERRHQQAVGASRATLYALAATTGLRRGELAALTWADIDLDAAEPVVRVRASTTKDGREARLPLHPSVIESLRGLRAAAGERPCRVFPELPTIRTLRLDLEAAGIPFETEAGLVDFHALRTSFATALARSGVSLAQAQKLLRHKDPKLTAVTYTRLEIADASAAVARIALPGVSVCRDVCRSEPHGGVQDGQSGGGAPLRATGTDGTAAATNSRGEWCGRRESNPQPSDPKSDALSS